MLIPKAFFKAVKSCTDIRLSLLQSPALISPISTCVLAAPVNTTVPALARKPGGSVNNVLITPSGPFTRQLYVPLARPPTGTVKKPLASVVCTG
jgi:hypothetical protein